MINKVILMGRLTRNPEVRYTSTNKPVCSFDVAVASGYGDSQKTDFINCIAWNKAAEFLGKYFNKGMMVIVGGRISTRTWEGKDGKKNYVTEVIANELDFGETKKARDEYNGYSRPKQQNSTPQKAADDFEVLDDLPNDLPF